MTEIPENARISIGVIVPVLNGARFLPPMLDSVTAQTRQPDEVVFIDGASTDGTLDLIQAWISTSPIRARWLSERDRGQADAINKGLGLVDSEYVGWLNADDLLEPRAIESVAAALESERDIDFVWGFCLVVNAQGTPLYIMNPFVREDLGALRHHRNFVPQPGSFFRRSLVERLGTLDASYHYMFDYEFFLRMAGKAKARFVPSVLARFRIHAASKTGRSHRVFLIEEERAFRAHGGSLMSPFYLDMWRFRYLTRPLSWLGDPVRRLLRRAMKLPAGSRIRP
jgi:glycosyltransferase involved in cell wall biosynthesis